uniref:Uncharacterized protein n=1 Tax=Anopheles epiroticus TaxID=199890 RepID=A0A182PFC7_9DIPT
MLSRSGLLSSDTDYRYSSNDCNNFTRCCLCGIFSPFIFYVDSQAAINCIKIALPPYHNFFCVNCLPQPTNTTEDGPISLYWEGSLFNNNDFLSLFDGYEYYHPDDRPTYYRNYDLIITEYCELPPNYMRIVCEPMPASVRMRKLYEIFPAVHQIPLNNYSSIWEMFSKVEQKYGEILKYYLTHMH